LIMRLKFTWHFALIFVLCAVSCDYEEDPVKEIEESTSDQLKADNPIIHQGISQFGRKSSNKLIIRFKVNTSEFSKANARNLLEVKNYERCSCGDSGLELWEFDPKKLPVGGIEEIKTKVDTDPDLEDSDFQYLLNLIGNTSFAGTSTAYKPYTKSRNDGITIAVIDSGLDPTIPDVNSPYLYNSEVSGPPEYKSVSGWDFVENDSIPQDEQGHGTIVTSIISEYLEAGSVPFQILPVRAFDKNGKGNLFDIACAIQYSVKNPDVDVINMSFGWYHIQSDIIGDLLSEASYSKIMVASAGNSTNNNDLIAHYPSGYTVSNLFSVASHDQVPTALAPFSNFGFQSVDFAAPGDYKIGASDNTFKGTSYSAAFTAAKSAEILYNQSPLIAPFSQYIMQAGTFRPELQALSILKFPYTIDP
ncbi:MAG: S8 family serine peptidase, partial [Cyclobacteriaceae bacterium]